MEFRKECQRETLRSDYELYYGRAEPCKDCGMGVELRSAAMELAECAQRSLCGVGVELRSAAMELAECAQRSLYGMGVELRSAAIERSGMCGAEPVRCKTVTVIAPIYLLLSIE
jgi:hypothetical protein